MRVDTRKIEAIIARSGLKKAEIAAKGGISRQTLYVIIGRGTCEPRTAGCLARALDVDVEDIMAEA